MPKTEQRVRIIGEPIPLSEFPISDFPLRYPPDKGDEDDKDEDDNLRAPYGVLVALAIVACVYAAIGLMWWVLRA